MAKNLNIDLIRRQPRPYLQDRQVVAQCRRIAREFWASHGSSYSYLLTRPDDNAKLAKAGKGGGMPTYGLSLAPAGLSGEWNTCPWSTPLCRRGCLNTAGKGELDRVQRGRRIKTLFLAAEPEAFLTILVAELNAATAKHGQILMRMNVLSDLDWRRIWPELFTIPNVTFYDYTKDADRAWRYIDGEMPVNYRIVFSASERTFDAELSEMLDMGGTVAMVFDKVVPAEWRNGRKVVNGDSSDDRWNDPGGVIVGLKAKGRMRGEMYREGGFVRIADGNGKSHWEERS